LRAPDESHTNLPDDVLALTSFIHELNIARRHLLTYPPGHPMITSATGKVLDLLNPLFAHHNSISLGVAKNSLLFEKQWLDKNNRSVVDFSRSLTELDIAAVHFREQPDEQELIKLATLLNSDRQTVNQLGGLEAYLQALQLRRTEITPVDYTAFKTTELTAEEQQQAATNLWEDFLNSLLDESLGQQQGATRLSSLDPKAIADFLNRNYSIATDSTANLHDRAIADFVRQVRNVGQQQNAPGQQFYQLLEKLEPELRRQFLDSTFRHVASQPTDPAETLQAFPTPMIELAMQELQQNQLSISSAMINLIGKLSQHHNASEDQLTSGVSDDLDSAGEKLKTLFREEDRGKFTPDSYQETLDRIIQLEQSFQLESEEIEELRRKILNSSGERQNCAIIFNLLTNPKLSEEHQQGMQQNLVDLAQYFLETGDFKGLSYLHQRLQHFQLQQPKLAAERTSQLHDLLNNAEFLQEVLNNLSRWGEKKQQEILDYIKLAGSSMAESLVERLANEEDKSLRRVYLTTLAGLGKAAHQAIYARLGDDRWFVIRNLLNILRLQNDPIDLEKISQFAKHPHLRVNQELLQLLFKFDRPQADSLLNNQLDSVDPQLRLHALQLAEQSKDPSITQKLIKLLNADKLTEASLPTKKQIIKSLAGSGTEESFLTLQKLLKPGLFFTSKRKLELQAEIIRNLDKFPPGKATPLLQKLTRSRYQQISQLAFERLRHLLRKQA